MQNLIETFCDLTEFPSAANKNSIVANNN